MKGLHDKRVNCNKQKITLSIKRYQKCDNSKLFSLVYMSLLENYGSSIILIICFHIFYLHSYPIPVTGNTVWRYYPIKVKCTKIIPYTHDDHLIVSLIIRIKSIQERYDYSECAPGINGTFKTNNAGNYIS